MSYQSDDEQVEMLKSLWKEYGQPLVLGVAITFAGITGYEYWQRTQTMQIDEASALYQQIVSAENESGNLLAQPQDKTPEQKATLKHLVGTLQKDHTDSTYASFATLFLARQHVQDGELDQAMDALEWVIAQSPEQEIEVIATTRLARVMLAQSADNAKEALEVLKPLDVPANYDVLIEAVKGDAYMAMGEQDNARTAYQKALDSANAQQLNRPQLELKLDDLTQPTNSQES